VTDIVLSIVMLAALAMVAGAFVLWRRTGEVKNPALMVLLAVIAVINVLIWTVPTGSGEAPIAAIKAAGEG
jgi:drug/metabolite transporter superfamily protein YnfA